MPKNEPLPKDVIYRGVKEAQWKIIDRLGDPLNCRKKVFGFQELDHSEFHQVFPKVCDKNPDCINIALKKHQRIMLRGGVYRIKTTVKLEKKVLVGHPEDIVVLNAHSKFTGIRMNKNVIANLRIENAINEGVKLDTNNLVYRIVVGNTGVYSSRSTRGIGIEQSSIFWWRNDQ